MQLNLSVCVQKSFRLFEGQLYLRLQEETISNIFEEIISIFISYFQIHILER